jgi:hypothetical protein
MDNEDDQLFREDELREDALQKALIMTQILGGRVDQTKPDAQAVVDIAQTFYTFLKGEAK